MNKQGKYSDNNMPLLMIKNQNNLLNKSNKNYEKNYESNNTVYPFNGNCCCTTILF